MQNGNAYEEGLDADIQPDALDDYRTNLPLYPAIQAYFREHQPPTLLFGATRTR